MSPDIKRRIVGLGSVVVIVAVCAWIYFTQIRVARHNEALHQRIGEVLAEQAVQALGKKSGRIVTIAIESREWPELKTQIASFNATLKKLGTFEVRDYELDTKDQPKYGVGSGLSGRRYVRTVNKNTNADLFVSFIGAPKYDKEEMAELTFKPRLIAEARAVDNLPKLFKNGLIEVAVVSRFQYPSPAPENPKTPDEWFVKRYQIVTAREVAGLPPPE